MREPYLNDPDFVLWLGDARAVLEELPDGSADTVVSSPPYWGLRDYGVEGQLGMEATPDEYVANIVALFREVRRVLADHGTVWLNLGDSYNNRSVARPSSHQGGLGFENESISRSWAEGTELGLTRLSLTSDGLKEKDMVGVPWMVAFALRADGWWLRSDIVWNKLNPMPESVTDRPTKSHEYVFLLSKRPVYYFDQEAVREPAEWNRWGTQTVGKYEGTATATGWMSTKTKEELNANRSSYKPGQTTGNTPNGHEEKSDEGLTVNPAGRNVRSVWSIATQPFADAHFATYPEELVRRCLLAGCPRQVCRKCGKPRERIVEETGADNHRVREDVGDWIREKGGNADGKRSLSGATYKPQRAATGEWTDCGHDDYRPGVVLDPFLGSGTTALVARRLNRHAVGIELSEEYAALAVKRCRRWWMKPLPTPEPGPDQLSLLS